MDIIQIRQSIQTMQPNPKFDTSSPTLSVSSDDKICLGIVHYAQNDQQGFVKLNATQDEQLYMNRTQSGTTASTTLDHSQTKNKQNCRQSKCDQMGVSMADLCRYNRLLTGKITHLSSLFTQLGYSMHQFHSYLIQTIFNRAKAYNMQHMRHLSSQQIVYILSISPSSFSSADLSQTRIYEPVVMAIISQLDIAIHDTQHYIQLQQLKIQGTHCNTSTNDTTKDVSACNRQNRVLNKRKSKQENKKQKQKQKQKVRKSKTDGMRSTNPDHALNDCTKKIINVQTTNGKSNPNNANSIFGFSSFTGIKNSNNNTKQQQKMEEHESNIFGSGRRRENPFYAFRNRILMQQKQGINFNTNNSKNKQDNKHGKYSSDQQQQYKQIQESSSSSQQQQQQQQQQQEQKQKQKQQQQQLLQKLVQIQMLTRILCGNDGDLLQNNIFNSNIFTRAIDSTGNPTFTMRFI